MHRGWENGRRRCGIKHQEGGHQQRQLFLGARSTNCVELACKGLHDPASRSWSDWRRVQSRRDAVEGTAGASWQGPGPPTLNRLEQRAKLANEVLRALILQKGRAQGGPRAWHVTGACPRMQVQN